MGDLENPEQEQEEREVRQKEIRRILDKVGKAWRKHPEKRLLDLLLNIEKDPDPRLDSRFLSDYHLEKLLDSGGRTKKHTMTVTFDHIFTMALHSIVHEGREEVEDLVRDLFQMTPEELVGDQATQPMKSLPGRHSIRLDKYRVVFKVVPEGVVLMDIFSEASIRFFRKAFKKKA